MEKGHEEMLPRQHVEALERRTLLSGTLTVQPVASVISSDAYIFLLPLAPNVGLKVAQSNSGGVVEWTPGT